MSSKSACVEVPVASEGTLSETLVHYVERPVKPFVVLPVRCVEQIELMGLTAATFPEFERGDPDETHRCAQVELADQRLGGFDNRSRGMGSGGEDGLPGVEPEIGGVEFHPDTPCGQPLAAQPARDGIRRPQQPGTDRGFADDVRVERVLRADALRLAFRDYCAVVEAVLEGMNVGAKAAEPSFEVVERCRRDIADGVETSCLEPRARAGPTPQSRSIGRGWRKPITSSGPTTVSPSGLRQSLATFATYLVVEAPTDTVSLVASKTAARIASPISRGPPESASHPVMSTNASSRLNGSPAARTCPGFA